MQMRAVGLARKAQLLREARVRMESGGDGGVICVGGVACKKWWGRLK